MPKIPLGHRSDDDPEVDKSTTQRNLNHSRLIWDQSSCESLRYAADTQVNPQVYMESKRQVAESVENVKGLCDTVYSSDRDAALAVLLLKR